MRRSFWLSTFLAIVVSASSRCLVENVLRPGYCEHDSDCAAGQYCVQHGPQIFRCAELGSSSGICGDSAVVGDACGEVPDDASVAEGLGEQDGSR